MGATTTYGPDRLAERSLEILCYSRTSTLTEKITKLRLNILWVSYHTRHLRGLAHEMARPSPTILEWILLYSVYPKHYGDSDPV